MSRQSLVLIAAVLVPTGPLLAGPQLTGRALPPADRGPTPRLVVPPRPGGQMDGLARLLVGQGYTAVPVDFLAKAHVVVTATVGDRRVRLVIDTGAPTTCLDPDRTKDLKLEWRGRPQARKDELFDHGLKSRVPELRIGGFAARDLPVLKYNAAPWNNYLGAEHGTDGVLGMDVLEPAEAVLDLPGRVLYVKPTGLKVQEVPGRAFVIPLVITPADAAGMERVQLYVSTDRGRTWRHHEDYAPTSADVVFRAWRDGEYWFASHAVMKGDGATVPGPSELAVQAKARVFTAVRSASEAPEDCLRGATAMAGRLLWAVQKLASWVN
jgi:hypothetical protein